MGAERKEQGRGCPHPCMIVRLAPNVVRRQGREERYCIFK